MSLSSIESFVASVQPDSIIENTVKITNIVLVVDLITYSK